MTKTRAVNKNQKKLILEIGAKEKEKPVTSRIEKITDLSLIIFYQS